MSLSFFVINGKIPAAKLKSALQTGKINGSKLQTITRERVYIQYDKKGYWDGLIKKGNVIEFVEYAGGHGGDKSQEMLIKQLERIFRCDITMDEDEYDRWTIKTTGKPLPKNPHAGCTEVMYSKKYPKGKCMDAPTGLPKNFWL